MINGLLGSDAVSLIGVYVSVENAASFFTEENKGSNISEILVCIYKSSHPGKPQSFKNLQIKQGPYA